jgi:hypothetical protein
MIVTDNTLVAVLKRHPAHPLAQRQRTHLFIVDTICTAYFVDEISFLIIAEY